MCIRDRKYIDDAIRIWSGLKEKYLTSKTYPRYLALAHTALGRAKARDQQPDEARRKFERSVAILQELLDKDVATDVLEAHSDALIKLADLERSLENEDRAESLTKKSIEQLKAAAQLNPDNRRLTNKLKVQTGH